RVPLCRKGDASRSGDRKAAQPACLVGDIAEAFAEENRGRDGAEIFGNASGSRAPKIKVDTDGENEFPHGIDIELIVEAEAEIVPTLYPRTARWMCPNMARAEFDAEIARDALGPVESHFRRLGTVGILKTADRRQGQFFGNEGVVGGHGGWKESWP